jgi:hypothetical protein
MHAFRAALAAVVLAATSAHAQEPTSNPAPCTAPEHRQFDFWLGEWDVRDGTGKVVGRNSITSVHKGCVVFESWNGQGGMTGASFNLYNAERKKWRQTWVDSSGGSLELEGDFSDGRMMLAGERGNATTRISWQQLPDGRVRQLWEVSSDQGKTWKTAFDGYYEKRK